MATGTTEFFDLTTTDVFIPEIWSSLVLEARRSKLLMAELVDRRYEESVRNFGDTIHVPGRSHLTVQTKNGSANAATVYESVTEANTDITLGTWQYTAIGVETMAQRQANRDLLQMYADEQGYALALAADDVLAGLVDDFSQTVGTLGVPNTFEEWLRANQYLDDADAPTNDRVILASPATKASMYQMDQFTDRDYEKLNADVSGNVAAATIGSWMGLRVLVSTNVEGSNAAGHDNGLFQKEALALVMQMEPTTHRMYDVDQFAWKVAVEQLYGVKEMRDNHGTWVQGA